jgi:hypothetical protein
VSTGQLSEEVEVARQRGLAALRPLASTATLSSDEQWARENLRWRGAEVLLDLANVVRILERHPDYQRRYKYNEVLTKVMDRGSVMLEWRINDLTAILQERFMPGVPVDLVARGLLVVSNRSG